MKKVQADRIVFTIHDYGNKGDPGTKGVNLEDITWIKCRCVIGVYDFTEDVVYEYGDGWIDYFGKDNLVVKTHIGKIASVSRKVFDKHFISLREYNLSEIGL